MGQPVRLERVRRKLADLAARDDGSFHQGELSYDAEPPLTEAELAAIEADLGFRFPTELRAFLHEVHGGGPGLLAARAYEEFAIDAVPGADFPLLEADTGEKLSLILQAEEHILGLENGRQRYIDEVSALSQAFAIAVPHEQAMEVRDEVGFLQAVKARLVKFDSPTNSRSARPRSRSGNRAGPSDPIRRAPSSRNGRSA